MRCYSRVAQLAHTLIRNFVSWGLLPHPSKLKCIDCGVSAVHYDHPVGYKGRRALIVEAVCSSCHCKRGYRRKEHKRPDFRLSKNNSWKGGISLNWKEYMRKYNREYKLGLRRKVSK